MRTRRIVFLLLPALSLAHPAPLPAAGAREARPALVLQGETDSDGEGESGIALEVRRKGDGPTAKAIVDWTYSGQEEPAGKAGAAASFGSFDLAFGPLLVSGPASAFSSRRGLFSQDPFAGPLFGLQLAGAADREDCIGLRLGWAGQGASGILGRSELSLLAGGDGRIVGAFSGPDLLGPAGFSLLVARVPVEARSADKWIPDVPPLPDCWAETIVAAGGVEGGSVGLSLEVGASRPETRNDAFAGRVIASATGTGLRAELGLELVQEGFVPPNGDEAEPRIRFGVDLDAFSSDETRFGNRTVGSISPREDPESVELDVDGYLKFATPLKRYSATWSLGGSVGASGTSLRSFGGSVGLRDRPPGGSEFSLKARAAAQNGVYCLETWGGSCRVARDGRLRSLNAGFEFERRADDAWNLRLKTGIAGRLPFGTFSLSLESLAYIPNSSRAEFRGLTLSWHAASR